MTTHAPGVSSDAPTQPVLLSRLLRRPVVTADHRAVGTVSDIVVRLRGSERPLVTGLVVALAGRQVFMTAGQVVEWGDDQVVLGVPPVEARAFERRDGEVLLRADVLGHRLVDIADARLVRAYDVQLVAGPAGWVVAGVGTQRPGRWRRPEGRDPSFRDWRSFEALIGHRPTVLVRSSFGRLRRLRAAQLADLLEDASGDERAEILAQVHVDPELEADVYEELDDARGALLAARADGDIAALLTRMHTDDAADALADLPQARRGAVLALLPDGQRAAVRDLLAYNEMTAGGLMGLEFLAVPAELTAGQGLAVVRAARGAPVESAVTVHLLAGSDHLAGTISLVRLLQAEPDAPLADLADRDPVRVTPDTDLADLTVLMADHNLPTLPVVDPDDRFLGVITVDDVLAAIVPSGWRDREPPTRPSPAPGSPPPRHI